MESGSRRYQKNWFRNESRMHDIIPSTHVRKVITGKLGSSVTGTVSATCSIGEFSWIWLLLETEHSTRGDVISSSSSFI